MMKHPTMTASFAASLLDFAAQKGADRSALLTAAGLTEADLAGKDARVPMRAYHALIRAAIEATQDGALILRHASETNLGHLSVVGLILNSSGPFRAAIRQLNRYSRLIADIDMLHAPDRFELRDERGQCWIVDHFPEPNTTPTAIEDTFSRFITEFRRADPERPFALEVEVTYPRPAHAAAYTEIWRAPVRFDAPRNAIHIAPHWLRADTEPEHD
ncbi:MAG TPA: AraC family transcriptional regulator, partial [Rhodobacterales bacterium]|nr:AraC family transcriptional regulator [Rhodobacterales bacterium]